MTVEQVPISPLDQPDVMPLQNGHDRTLRLMATIAFGLLCIAALYFAKTLVAPVLSAAIVSITLGPLAVRAARYRIPPVLFALFCVVMAILAVNMMLVVLGGVVSDWAAQAPQIGVAIKEKAKLLAQPLAMLKEIQLSLTEMFGGPVGPEKLELSATAIVAPVIQFLSPAISELVLFFGCLFFFIASRGNQRQQFVMMFSTRDARLRALRILNNIEYNFARYVLVVTVINIALGCMTALIAYIAGLPNPLVFGLIAGLLNYIPYVGPAMVTAILFVVGLVALPSLPAAAVAPALFIATAFVEGQLISPGIIGRQMTVSPLSVFLSLAFWTWLWGPLGTLLATPFLIAMMVIYEYALSEDEIELPG